jgi:hypothetical protein
MSASFQPPVRFRRMNLFYSANRGEWVPIGSMRPGELLRGESGVTSPILAISPPRHGFIELYGIEVEEFHTYFVGGEGGSALVHNGMGDCFKKPLQSAYSNLQIPNPAFKFVGAARLDSLRSATHAAIVKAFEGTGLTPTGHFISRIKDARLEGLGLHTFKDLENVLRYGTPVFQDGGTVAVVYGKLAIIVDPVRKTLVTVQPWK